MSWHGLVDFVMQNKIVFGLLATAGISTMPAADCPVNWRTLYQWIYDWAHVFLNFKRPMQPVGNPPPANPKP